MFCKTASVSVKLACISNSFGEGCIQNFGFSFHLAGALCLSATLLHTKTRNIFWSTLYLYVWRPTTLFCKAALTFRILGLISIWQARCAFQPLFYKEYFGVPFTCTYEVMSALFCKVTLTFRILGSGRRGVPFKFQPLFYTLKQVNMFWSTFYLHVWGDVQRPCSGKRLVHPISLVRGVF